MESRNMFRLKTINCFIKSLLILVIIVLCVLNEVTHYVGTNVTIAIT